MTPEVITALQALVGRALTTEEQAALAPLVAARNDVAIAALLSVGRVRVQQPHLIGTGTLSDALGLPAGPIFVRSLRLAAEAPLPDGAPMEALARKAMVEQAWLLLSGQSLDIGLSSVRFGIDGMVGVLPGLTPEGAAAIKRLAERPDPLPFGAVSDALNKAQGLMTLGG